ncbi:MAG: acyl-CoA dehydrogenase family protein [Actinomycetota bacterium]
MEPFLQTPPRLPDAWMSDRPLQETLRFYLGDRAGRAEPLLAELGAWATDPATLAKVMQAESELPTLTHYGTWGERIDRIDVSDAYTHLGKEGVRRGVVAQAYESEPFGELSRVVWAALIYLWGPSSALYSCPIAMTDAAARTLLAYGDAEDAAVAERLISRDPEHAWTSGQWMTETAGGSDVGRTGTVARREGDAWRLYGLKWFTSATTSEVALTLARPEGAPQGSRGLGLFRIHRNLEDGSPNAIFVRRLKDKLGTRSMPTAELELDGALAYPVGDPSDGRGVAKISTMLNITRLHNGLASAAALARGIAWARAFARTREVFGARLDAQPAHLATLADLAVDHQAALALCMRCAYLLGRVEAGVATDQEIAVLRGLTPVTKLTTARWAVAGTTEAMECLGGVGYCEDSGLPALVRNSHVLPIWEGTTNVLSLDLLRADQRSGAVAAVLDDVERACSAAEDHPASTAITAAIRDASRELKKRMDQVGNDEEAQVAARSAAMSLGSIYACALLAEQGSWAASNGDDRTLSAARRMVRRGLLAPEAPDDLQLAMDATEAR